MSELFEASVRFPTVVFTIGLGIALIYWLFVLIGALDIDILGGADAGDALTGGAKGGAEALKGAGADADADGLFAKLQLGVVPLTITISLILLVGWIGTFLSVEYLMPALGWGTPLWLLPVMVVGSILMVSVVVRPLAPVFRIREGKTNRDYVGHTCTISTATADDTFGHASVEDGGSTLDIPVRCDRAGILARGDKALIIDFDEARQAYLVEPVASILSSSKADDRS